jgi:hypothetical protein
MSHSIRTNGYSRNTPEPCRGTTADRLHRMSWASDRSVAEELGRRHARYGPAALYKATVPSDMILAYLERRLGDGRSCPARK